MSMNKALLALAMGLALAACSNQKQAEDSATEAANAATEAQQAADAAKDAAESTTDAAKEEAKK